MDKAILPECYADTLLLQILIPTATGYNHKHSCFKVEAEMKNGKFKDKFAVGIIDKDKKAISYLSEFTKEDICNEELILWKHPGKQHFIIQICPVLEVWIMNVCKQAHINLPDFLLNDNLEDFRKITKTMSSLTDERLIKLFSAIRERTDIKAVKKLINWITILKEQNYQVNIDNLR